MKLKVVNKRNTLILAFIIFVVHVIFDNNTNILNNTNPFGALAYSFGSVYIFSFIISAIAGGLSKLFKGDFNTTFFSTFFYMLILISFVFVFQNYIQ